MKYNPATNEQFDIYDVLGLKISERSIMVSLIGLAKGPAIIARHAKVSLTTVIGILTKLEKRKLVRKIKHDKKTIWKSNLPRIIRHFKNIPPNHSL